MLTYDALLNAVRAGWVSAPETAVGPSSIDLTLGDGFLLHDGFLSPSKPRRVGDPLHMTRAVDEGYGVMVQGRGICLATTQERFDLPRDIAGTFYVTSTVGRSFLGHLTSIVIHPGFHGTLTLELFNYAPTPVWLFAGDTIGQVRLEKVANVPCHLGSRYDGQVGPTPGMANGN